MCSIEPGGQTALRASLRLGLEVCKRRKNRFSLNYNGLYSSSPQDERGVPSRRRDPQKKRNCIEGREEREAASAFAAPQWDARLKGDRSVINDSPIELPPKSFSSSWSFSIFERIWFFGEPLGTLGTWSHWSHWGQVNYQ
jgi:hypothetical protein